MTNKFNVGDTVYHVKTPQGYDAEETSGLFDYIIKLEAVSIVQNSIHCKEGSEHFAFCDWELYTSFEDARDALVERLSSLSQSIDIQIMQYNELDEEEYFGEYV